MPVVLKKQNPLKDHPLEGRLREAIAQGDYRYLTGVAQVEERWGSKAIGAHLRRQARLIQQEPT